MSFWNYKLNYEQQFKTYHLSTINMKEFAPNQQYPLKLNKKESNLHLQKDLIDFPLNYKICLDNLFEKTITERNSLLESFTGKKITKEIISKFCQIAFIGNKRVKRNYPSGGEMYSINIFFLFNPQFVKENTLERKNIGYVSFEKHSLSLIEYKEWDVIITAFHQMAPMDITQFVIILSIDINNVSDKYHDISYKLIQQEAGHIGQNILLVAQYLGLGSIPSHAFYDIELAEIIGHNQTILSTYLLG